MERRARVLALLTVGAVLVAGTFLWGSYLLGAAWGFLYAMLAACLMWLFARYLTQAGRPSPLRIVAVLALSLPIGFVMACPTSVSPDLQYFIEKQATDRAARKELARVFSSDPAYSDLSVSTTHLKVVNVTVRGSLHGRPDHDRLRARIAAECPTLEQCFLHWDVALLESGERLNGLDRDLFKVSK